MSNKFFKDLKKSLEEVVAYKKENWTYEEKTRIANLLMLLIKVDLQKKHFKQNFLYKNDQKISCYLKQLFYIFLPKSFFSKSMTRT